MNATAISVNTVVINLIYMLELCGFGLVKIHFVFCFHICEVRFLTHTPSLLFVCTPLTRTYKLEIFKKDISSVKPITIGDWPFLCRHFLLIGATPKEDTSGVNIQGGLTPTENALP